MFLRLKILLHNKNVLKKITVKRLQAISQTEFSLKTANQDPCINVYTLTFKAPTIFSALYPILICPTALIRKHTIQLFS